MINHLMQESIIEEIEDDSDSEHYDASVDSDKINIFSPDLKTNIKDEDVEPKVYRSNQKDQMQSPNISPMESPRAARNRSSTNPHIHRKKESKFLRLLSNRFRGSTISDHSLSSSPDTSSDHIFNGDEEEAMVCHIRPSKFYYLLQLRT
jgi:hypothetical protein